MTDKPMSDCSALRASGSSPQRKTPPCMMLIGRPPKGMKSSTIVLLSRRYRSKWWTVVCFGQKSHYRADGSCEHTDELLAGLKRPPREMVRVLDGRKEAQRVAA